MVRHLIGVLAIVAAVVRERRRCGDHEQRLRRHRSPRRREDVPDRACERTGAGDDDACWRDALAEVASGGATYLKTGPATVAWTAADIEDAKSRTEPQRRTASNLGQPEHGRPGDARLSAGRASRAGRDPARERLRRPRDRDVEGRRRALLERDRSERAPVRLLPRHRPRNRELVRRRAGSRLGARLGDDSGAHVAPRGISPSTRPSRTSTASTSTR